MVAASCSPSHSLVAQTAVVQPAVAELVQLKSAFAKSKDCLYVADHPEHVVVDTFAPVADYIAVVGSVVLE